MVCGKQDDINKLTMEAHLKQKLMPLQMKNKECHSSCEKNTVAETYHSQEKQSVTLLVFYLYHF
jgi:hypothetical protein